MTKSDDEKASPGGRRGDERDGEREDELWLRGYRAAYQAVLGQCISELHGSQELKAEALLKEREAAMVQLRMLCDDFGDNDWDGETHLADVVSNHLAKHLQPARETATIELTQGQYSELLGTLLYVKMAQGGSPALEELLCLVRDEADLPESWSPQQPGRARS